MMQHYAHLRILRSSLLSGAVLFLTVASFAQVTNTGIHGIVRDASGATVPNATVKATDTGTGIEKSTTTAQDGGFVFPNLQAATYKIAVSASGFQTAVLDSVVVDTGRVTDVPVTLAVGASARRLWK